MSTQDNLDLAKQFLAKLGGGASPEEIAQLFSTDLVWQIPGDTGVLPWIGAKTGRAAVIDFVRQSSDMIERLSLNIQDVLASEGRAVILGDLASRVKRTGKVIETEFAIVLTIQGKHITKFLMLEDSFATAKAARD